MTFGQVENALNTLVASTMAALTPALPVLHDNAQAAGTDVSSLAEFCRAVVRIGSGEVQTICQPKRVRWNGVLIIQLCLELNVGTARASAIALAIYNAFSDKTLSGIRMRTTVPTAVGEIDGHWQVNVTCPFEFDDITTL
jgi:hypothetical protein